MVVVVGVRYPKRSEEKQKHIYVSNTLRRIYIPICISSTSSMSKSASYAGAAAAVVRCLCEHSVVQCSRNI